ncbi:sigma-54 dependent transcriptional regulator [bacterium]|nr:sigma-54 dependent transcriptional regulator [bacterium]
MTDSADILVVDDEELILFVLKHLLKVHGFTVHTATRGEEAIDMVASRRPDLVILDIRMPGIDGFEVLKRLHEVDASLPVILMTALSSVRDAVDGIKAGAFDYVAKPFDNDEMVKTIRRALAYAAGMPLPEKEVEEELHPLLADLSQAEELQALARSVQRIARAGEPCLLTGELGCGKRRLARLMHEVSERQGEMLVVECAGATESLLQAELYGGGRATGPSRAGKFERLRDGTLFFDEILEMPQSLQERLARDIERDGYAHPATGAWLKLGAAVICSSSQPIEEVHDGLVPELLAIFEARVLHLPPLRERLVDIPVLAQEFIEESAREFDRPAPEITEAALDALRKEEWQGNVHQLKATIRRAVLIAAESIEARHVEIRSLRDVMPALNMPPITVKRTPLRNQVREHVARVERDMILDILKRTDWNKARASRILGITYKTMLKKVSEYHLDERYL